MYIQHHESRRDAKAECKCKVWTTIMASAEPDKQIFEVNPYDGHASLTQLEAEVLWEYAKLSQHVKIVSKC